MFSEIVGTGTIHALLVIFLRAMSRKTLLNQEAASQFLTGEVTAYFQNNSKNDYNYKI